MKASVTAPDGVRIAYDSVGEGAAVFLIHGFASDRVQNWRAPGWYDTLTGAGYRVVAMDCRGHGESDKPRDPRMYGHDVMAGDAVAVMDAEGLAAPVVMGYSMGGHLGIQLVMHHGGRVARLVIGGVGETYLTTGLRGRSAIADALETDDTSTIATQVARDFRAFAEQAGKDRKALAACMRAERKPVTAEQLSRVRQPVLVVCGEKDVLTGAPDGLAAAFPNGRAVTVPKRDHMTTVGDKLYKQAVLDFLSQ
jgi:pimeloyl-ACP methyl ester carboxylesterase